MDKYNTNWSQAEADAIGRRAPELRLGGKEDQLRSAEEADKIADAEMLVNAPRFPLPSATPARPSTTHTAAVTSAGSSDNELLSSGINFVAGGWEWEFACPAEEAAVLYAETNMLPPDLTPEPSDAGDGGDMTRAAAAEDSGSVVKRSGTRGGQSGTTGATAKGRQATGTVGKGRVGLGAGALGGSRSGAGDIVYMGKLGTKHGRGHDSSVDGGKGGAPESLERVVGNKPSGGQAKKKGKRAVKPRRDGYQHSEANKGKEGDAAKKVESTVGGTNKAKRGNAKAGKAVGKK
jgi:hypothetical protein